MDSYIPRGQYKLQVTVRPGTLKTQEVYVKEITFPKDIHPDDKEKEIRRLSDQIRIGMNLHHPHHIKLLHYEAEHSTHSLYYSIASGKRLDDIIKERNFETEEVLLITEQIATALAYCHDNFIPPILHGDLSPGNIIYDAQKKHATVIDHSAAISQIVTEEHYTTRALTYGFAAPEVARGEITAKSDVFGLGMLLTYMITSQHPGKFFDHYFTLEKKKLEEALAQGTTNESLVNLVSRMTKIEADRRPNAAEVIEYVQQIRNGETVTAGGPTIDPGSNNNFTRREIIWENENAGNYSIVEPATTDNDNDRPKGKLKPNPSKTYQKLVKTIRAEFPIISGIELILGKEAKNVARGIASGIVGCFAGFYASHYVDAIQPIALIGTGGVVGHAIGRIVPLLYEWRRKT